MVVHSKPAHHAFTRSAIPTLRAWHLGAQGPWSSGRPVGASQTLWPWSPLGGAPPVPLGHGEVMGVTSGPSAWRLGPGHCSAGAGRPSSETPSSPQTYCTSRLLTAYARSPGLSRVGTWAPGREGRDVGSLSSSVGTRQGSAVP